MIMTSIISESSSNKNMCKDKEANLDTINYKKQQTLRTIKMIFHSINLPKSRNTKTKEMTFKRFRICHKI